MAELQAPLDPERLLTTLSQHGVKFVLIGALGARMQGFPRMTADADITPASEISNVENLASALRKLRARVYTEGVPGGLAFDCTASTLVRARLWNLVTDAGRVDIVFEPAGTGGYDDLAPNAVRFEVYGVELLVARLEDIIRSKKAADRPQDRQDVQIMLEMISRGLKT